MLRRTSTSRIPRWAIALGLVLAVGLVQVPEGALAQDGEAGERVATILDDAAQGSIEGLWARTSEIAELGDGAVDALEDGLEASSPQARLVAARALLEMEADGSREVALGALRDLVGADVEREVRVQACEVLDLFVRRRTEVEPLFPVFRQVRDPYVRIALARLLRSKARYVEATEILKDYIESEDYDVRAAAALALGEVGNVEAARDVLDELRQEPTERGRYALSLLTQEELLVSLQEATAGMDDPEDQIEVLRQRVEELQAELEQARASGGDGEGAEFAQELLNEIQDNIQRFYDYEEEEEVSDESLLDAAAHGMVNALDPFSSYMNPDEVASFQESMEGQYGGIGAVVSIDPTDRVLTIIRPIYDGPAYEAGLRSLDKITEVEGEPTAGRSVNELVSHLKGEPGTPVDITVWRRGWQEAREYTLIRREISLDSVHYTMLPGNVGYISLSHFGETATEEVEDALQDLEGQGMEGLLFDLRANPGGLLTAAVDIADKFLGGERLIVYSEGRNQYIAPRREFRTREQVTHPDVPMVVLVDGSSASASEIVAGALQDHDRAELVGTQTFGKGSVQQLMPLESMRRDAMLRLTIAKYYLPSGRSIHETGVEPDVVTENDGIPSWVDDALDEVRDQGSIDRYVDRFFEEHRETFQDLAWYDEGDASAYPGFDEWYENLGTMASRDFVRRALRARIRRRVQDVQGHQFACDVQEDTQLRRGILELYEGLGIEPGEFAEFEGLTQEFAEAR